MADPLTTSSKADLPLSDAQNAQAVPHGNLGAAGNDNLHPQIASKTLVADTMYCGTCMVSIEETLSALPGVKSARVNLTTKRVNVRFDPAQTDSIELISALEGIGFPSAELVEGRESQTDERNRDFL